MDSDAHMLSFTPAIDYHPFRDSLHKTGWRGAASNGTNTAPSNRAGLPYWVPIHAARGLEAIANLQHHFRHSRDLQGLGRGRFLVYYIKVVFVSSLCCNRGSGAHPYMNAPIYTSGWR